MKQWIAIISKKRDINRLDARLGCKRRDVTDHLNMYYEKTLTQLAGRVASDERGIRNGTSYMKAHPGMKWE